MNRVEYKDTLVVKFTTQAFDEDTEEFVDVIPTSYSAFLESFKTIPEQIVELTDIETTDGSNYYVRFYASPDTHEIVVSGLAYYIAFYWEYAGRKKCKREIVTVVANA